MNATQTLGVLIRDRQASTGWSYRDLALRSPAGAGLNKSRWGELRRDEVKTFSGAQLRGIAEALGISESIVGRAALATMGVTARDGNAARVEDAVRTDNELSEHDRRILLAVLREMRMERGGNADSTAPITHAGESPATDEDDLARRRRERQATEDPEQETIPLPDEALMAGYDEPQESILARERQDADAESSQD